MKQSSRAISAYPVNIGGSGLDGEGGIALKQANNKQWPIQEVIKTIPTNTDRACH